MDILEKRIKVKWQRLQRPFRQLFKTEFKKRPMAERPRGRAQERVLTILPLFTWRNVCHHLRFESD
jgi:hypothetical protein